MDFTQNTQIKLLLPQKCNNADCLVHLYGFQPAPIPTLAIQGPQIHAARVLHIPSIARSMEVTQATSPTTFRRRGAVYLSDARSPTAAHSGTGVGMTDM